MALTNDDLLAISQLLDAKLEPIKQDITNVKSDINQLDKKLTLNTNLVLDEVVRVHEILNKHKSDTSKHIA